MVGSFVSCAMEKKVRGVVVGGCVVVGARDGLVCLFLARIKNATTT